MGWYRDGTRKVEGKGKGVGLNGCEACRDEWHIPPNPRHLSCHLFFFFVYTLDLGIWDFFWLGKGEESVWMDGSGWWDANPILGGKLGVSSVSFFWFFF